MIKITLPARILHAVNLFASRDETRYYLMGVGVEARGDHAIFVATDGYGLLAVRVPVDCGEGSAVIIPSELIKKVNKRWDCTLSYDNKTASIEQDKAASTSPLIDGTFPDWRRVIPREFSGEPAHFYAPQLMRCQEAMVMLKPATGFAKIGGCGVPFARVLPNGNGPGLVDLGSYPDGIEAVCVLMPVRQNDSFPPIPAWAR